MFRLAQKKSPKKLDDEITTVSVASLTNERGASKRCYGRPRDQLSPGRDSSLAPTVAELTAGDDYSRLAGRYSTRMS